MWRCLTICGSGSNASGTSKENLKGVSYWATRNFVDEELDAKLFIFSNPSARARYDTRSVFKRSLTGLKSEFSFSKTSCNTKAKELSLPYYFPIAGGRIIGFIPFPRVLVLCEIQSVSFRIWTRVTVSISYDNNHYTTGTSMMRSYWPGMDEDTERVMKTCRVAHWQLRHHR